MIMLAINREENLKVSDYDLKNLFISLGCLVIKNYIKIILEYDKKLDGEIKRILTLVINNLQLCGQLQNRIFGLKEGLRETEIQLEDNLSEKEIEELKARKKRFNKSLKIKEKRFSQLNQENVDFLLKIGRWFYQKKLLEDNDDFKKIYQQLDLLLEEENMNNFWQEIAAKNLDKKWNNLYNLLQPYPSFLV